jgi:hypothetical protein
MWRKIRIAMNDFITIPLLLLPGKLTHHLLFVLVFDSNSSFTNIIFLTNEPNRNRVGSCVSCSLLREESYLKQCDCEQFGDIRALYRRILR